MSRKLFVDLGHSKKYPGASGVTTEVQWNRAIWTHLSPLLDRKMYEVQLVPDKYVTDWSGNRNLINRINWINKRSTAQDFLLSIHGNWAANPKVRGVTTCYMGGSKSAQNEAEQLSTVYAQITQVPVWHSGAFDDRNARFGRIGMVRDTKPFALLIEAGFVTNREDMAINIVNAAKAIAQYYNTFAW